MRDTVFVGTIVLPGRVIDDGYVLVADGIVQQVGEGAAPVGEVHGGPGMLVLPGAIDAQVHSRSQKGQEDFIWSTRSAAAGGVTTIVDMPYDDGELISTGALVVFPVELPPALLTRISILPPSAATASAWTEAAPSSVERSPIATPAAPIAAATASARSRLRPCTTTAAPSAASTRATPSPMPLLLPVTSARFPASLRSKAQSFHIPARPCRLLPIFPVRDVADPALR